jgi:VWFA-related protein
MSSTPILTSLLAVALVAASAAAQPPAISEAISVELVNVEVHVVDGDGRPVAGLPREAFRLSEDGRPAAISHFAWVPPVDSPATAAGTSDAAPPRRVAVFFDELQVGERSRKALLDALAERLSAGLADGDLVSVVRFDGSRLELLLPWSRDRGDLAEALDALGGYSPGRLLAAQEKRGWIQAVRQSIDFGACNNTGQFVRAYSDFVKRQVEASATALLRYAQRLAHEPGRRLVLHVSDGIPMIAGGDVHQWAAEMCDGTALMNGVPGAFAVFFDSPSVDGNTRDRWDPDQARMQFMEYSNAELWRDVAARVNALGVTLYPLLAGDANALFQSEVEGQTMTSTSWSAVRQNTREPLSFLAEATGGLLLDVTSGEAAQLDRLLADLGGYYSLAFAPTESARPGLRELAVAVDRPGVAVRHRRSYRLLGRDERVAMRLAELFEAEHVDNPLGLALDVRADPDAGARRLRIVVPFGRLSMVESPAGGEEGRFTVFIALRRDGGRLALPRQRSIVARRADAAATAYTYEVTLPAESFREVAVAVADDFSGAVAFARQRLRPR